MMCAFENHDAKIVIILKFTL